MGHSIRRPVTHRNAMTIRKEGAGGTLIEERRRDWNYTILPPPLPRSLAKQGFKFLWGEEGKEWGGAFQATAQMAMFG